MTDELVLLGVKAGGGLNVLQTLDHEDFSQGRLINLYFHLRFFSYANLCE